MSTTQERQQRANENDAEYAARQQVIVDRNAMEQACEDALRDMHSPEVLRVRAAIRRVSLEDIPDPILRQYADVWLKATDKLVERATAKLKDKAVRLAKEALPPPL